MKPSILVTGSKGFIGSRVLSYLQQKGYQVVGTTEDIRNINNLRPHFKNIDIVVHAAGKLRGARNDNEYHEINFLGTKNVAQLCLEGNIKMIHLSSIASEGAYGKSKQDSHKLVENLALNNNLKVAMLRLCAVHEGRFKNNGYRYSMEQLLKDIENLILKNDFNKYTLITYPNAVSDMKNIFFYIYKEKRFAPEYVLMSQAQIDNSLDYWRPEDIIVVTNFPWEYRGIKSLVVGDELNAEVESHGTSLSNKPIVIKYLIEKNLVGSINWFHDWDIFQLAHLDLPLIDKDIALVEYSYKPQIQLGSIFFKPSSYDIFQWIDEAITKYKINEEDATNLLIKENFNNINNRFTKLNVTYSIGMRNVRETINKAEKPLRIAHFPPYKPKYLYKAKAVLSQELFSELNAKFTLKEPKMKNLLVYISPDKKFKREYELMLQVQIDNSLDYWQREDIILLTNFPYEYNGIKAIVGPDNLINKTYAANKRAIVNSKVNAIIYLLENKIINELTWFHDLDSFQLTTLDLPPIKADLGVLTYGIYPESRLIPLRESYKYRINFGNIFFKPESLDIFKMLLAKMDQEKLYEEDAMTLMFAQNYNNIASRTQIMNQTYGIGSRYVRSNIAISQKPLRIAHFPPYSPGVLFKFRKVLPSKLYKMLDEKFTPK